MSFRATAHYPLSARATTQNPMSFRATAHLPLSLRATAHYPLSFRAAAQNPMSFRATLHYYRQPSCRTQSRPSPRPHPGPVLAGQLGSDNQELEVKLETEP